MSRNDKWKRAYTDEVEAHNETRAKLERHAMLQTEAEPSLSMVYSAIMELRAEVRKLAPAGSPTTIWIKPTVVDPEQLETIVKAAVSGRRGI